VTWVGSVYVGVGRWIVAVNENGTLRWVYPAGGTVNAISVAGDGTVYAAVRDQFGLYALNSNGTLRWVFRNPLNPRVGIGEVFAAPSLSGTGIAYVMSAWNAPPSLRGVYAVNLDGSLRWRRSTTGSVPPVVTPSVAIDANQTVYVVGLGLLSIGP
jgi:outer membrane protein assembly factor BamB